MAQSLANLLIHLVYSTKGRQVLLPHDPFADLHKFAPGIFADQECHLIEMNNVADHVHILFDLHRTETLANVVMHMTKGTSRWLKEQSAREEFRKFLHAKSYMTNAMFWIERPAPPAAPRWGAKPHWALVSQGVARCCPGLSCLAPSVRRVNAGCIRRHGLCPAASTKQFQKIIAAGRSSSGGDFFGGLVSRFFGRDKNDCPATAFPGTDAVNFY